MEVCGNALEFPLPFSKNLAAMSRKLVSCFRDSAGNWAWLFRECLRQSDKIACNVSATSLFRNMILPSEPFTLPAMFWAGRLANRTNMPLRLVD